MSVENDVLREIYNRFQPKLSAPHVSIRFVGVPSNVTYSYVVTAVGDTGETDGALVSVVGSSTLNYDNYVELTWVPVKYAKKYRVYGRKSGSEFGLITETYETSYIDYGLVVPDTNVKPPEENKTGRLEWESVEFLPGRALQSAELNEIQSMLRYSHEQLAKTIFNDGDVVSGCDITVDLDNLKVYLGEGKVFVAGRVRDVSSATLSITGSGIETIGLKVVEEYIDASDDAVLLDPAQGWPGYATSGALRKIVKLEWVKDDPNAITVYRLYNGSPVKVFEKGAYSTLENYLAQRVDEISGNVVAEGLELRIYPSKSRRDKIVFEVSPGIAYVNGYRISKSYATKWEEDVALDYDTTVEIASPRQSGSYVYELDAKPVAFVVKVTGSFFIGQTRTVPSSPVDQNGWYIDTLSYPSIDEVLGLWNNSSKQVQYVKNTDYIVVGNEIHLNPNTFTPGQSYYTEYYYFGELTKGKRSLNSYSDTYTGNGSDKTFLTSKSDVVNTFRYPLIVKVDNVVKKEGVDYVVNLGRTETSIGVASVTFATAPPNGSSVKLEYYYWNHDVEGDYVSVDSYLPTGDMYGSFWYDAIVEPDVIDFRTGGSRPDKEDIIVEYRYFLSQAGWLTLDREGMFSFVRGVSGIRPVFPVRPSTSVVLAGVLLGAYSQKDIVVKNLRKYRVVKQYDLSLMKERVERLEYNLALSQAEMRLVEKQTPSPKKAILVDSFVDLDAVDKNQFNASMETWKGHLILPVDFWSSFVKASTLNGVASKDVVLIKSYNHVVADYQPIWTGVTPLNPYDAFGPPTTFRIYPETDYWVEKQDLGDVFQNYTIDLGDIGYMHQSQIANVVKTKVAEILKIDPSLIKFQDLKYGYVWCGQNVPTSTGYGVFTLAGDKTFSVKLLPYLRQIVVYFNLKGHPLVDNIKIYFDGVEVSASVASQSELNNLGIGWTAGGYNGSVSGTVKTDENGNVVGKFMIPKDVLAGMKTVEAVREPFIYGKALFIGQGVLEEWLRANKSYYVKFSGQFYSPLAQTFRVEKDMFVSAVAVWFAQVPPDSQGVVKCAIRGTTVGIPNDEIYGEVSKTTQEIIAEAGLNPNTGMIDGDPSWTNGKVWFEFPHPIFLEGGKVYSIVLEDPSPGYYVFTATVRETIRGDLSGQREKGSILNFQPHGGVLLLSVNNNTWTPYQEKDLMFYLYRADFDTDTVGVATFEDVTSTRQFSEFVHSLKTLVPAGTQLIFEYSTDGSHWYPYEAMTPLGDEDTLQLDRLNIGQMTSTLKLRAKFITKSELVSPVIWKAGNIVVLYRYDSPGEYVSQNVEVGGTDYFEYIYLWIQSEIPMLGELEYMKVSFDGGETWYNMPQVSVDVVQAGWQEYEFGGHVQTITNNARSQANEFKIRFKFNNDNYEYYTPVFRLLRIVVY